MILPPIWLQASDLTRANNTFFYNDTVNHNILTLTSWQIQTHALSGSGSL